MFGRNCNNGNVKWLGDPDFLSTDVPPWTANILATHPSWGYQGSIANPNWGSGYGGNYDSISVTWSRTARVLPIYHQRVFEKKRSAARRVCDNLLPENRMYCMQSPSTFRNPICGCLVKWQDDDWDDLWDDTVDQ